MSETPDQVELAEAPPSVPGDQPAAGSSKQTVDAAAALFGSDTSIAALGSVPVDIQVVLGSTRMPISNILKLGRGAVVEIDRKVGEAVDIHINRRLVARGEVVIVDDDRLGVTLTEIINLEPGHN